MNLEEFEWRCASSASPSAIWAFLFNFSCPVGQCVQGSSRKMWVSSRALEIFLFAFLDWPDFHFAQYLFLVWMPFKKLWDMYFCYFSRWRWCKRIQIVNFKRGKTRAELTCSSCSALGCCVELVDVAEKIMKTVSLSSTQPVALECVFQIFARKSVRFRRWTKSLTLN